MCDGTQKKVIDQYVLGSCTGFISHLISAFYWLRSLASIDELEWLKAQASRARQ